MTDGSSRRVGNILATDARYSPDGKLIAIAAGGILLPGTLWVALANGFDARRLFESKDLSIVVPCWSADGRRIAFGQVDRATQRRSAWEIGVDGTGLRRLVPDFQPKPSTCCMDPEWRLATDIRGSLLVRAVTPTFSVEAAGSDPTLNRRSVFHPSHPTPTRTHLRTVPGRNSGSSSASIADREHGNRISAGVSSRPPLSTQETDRVSFIQHTRNARMWVCRADRQSCCVQLTRAPMEAEDRAVGLPMAGVSRSLAGARRTSRGAFIWWMQREVACALPARRNAEQPIWRGCRMGKRIVFSVPAGIYAI